MLDYLTANPPYLPSISNRAEINRPGIKKTSRGKVQARVVYVASFKVDCLAENPPYGLFFILIFIVPHKYALDLSHFDIGHTCSNKLIQGVV
jgi:hypothetical protein